MKSNSIFQNFIFPKRNYPKHLRSSGRNMLHERKKDLDFSQVLPLPSGIIPSKMSKLIVPAFFLGKNQRNSTHPFLNLEHCDYRSSSEEYGRNSRGFLLNSVHSAPPYIKF